MLIFFKIMITQHAMNVCILQQQQPTLQPDQPSQAAGDQTGNAQQQQQQHAGSANLQPSQQRQPLQQQQPPQRSSQPQQQHQADFSMQGDGSNQAFLGDEVDADEPEDDGGFLWLSSGHSLLAIVSSSCMRLTHHIVTT